MEEAATFISLHNGKGERTLFSLLFSYPPFSIDRGRAGGGGGRREEGKRLLGWHGKRRIANSCNITAHRSKEMFGTRSRVSRMCCVPCLISWRNPCQREAGKCQKLRGGRESFFGCVVCLSYCRRRKRGEIQLHCFPFLRSSLLQFPLFSIVSISSFSPFFLPAITVGRQRKCKEEERHGKTKRGPFPSPSLPLPFLWQLFKKKLSFPSFFPSISPLFDGQLRLLCTRNKKKTKFPLRVYTRLLPRLPSGDFHERMIMTIATRDRGRNFSSSNQVFFLPIQLLFLFPFVPALLLLPCGKKRTEIRRFETDFENCSIFFLDIRPMFELQIWKRSI